MIESLEALLSPIVSRENCEIYSVEYLKEGSDRVLRLTIDKEAGVSLDDCENVSRKVSALLDQLDPIKGEYRLQVSSPGVERKLKKPQHFIRYIGHKVEVKLFAPLSPEVNRKKFTGKLLDYKSNEMVIKTLEDELFTFHIQQVSSCKLLVFD